MAPDRVDTLRGPFDWVGLWNNFWKNVGMVCQPCQAVGVRADDAYKRRIPEEVLSYQEIKWERVQCPECRKDLVRGSMATHRQKCHNVAKRRVGYKDEEGGGGDKPRTFWMTFSVNTGPRPCPVEGCSGKVETWKTTRVHFWNRHVWNTVVILEDSNLPLPR